MPDVNGKLFFQEYKNELKARGFDGFSDIDLGSFVNRGYIHVARQSTWYWEEQTDSFDLAQGAASVDLWPTPNGELPNFRSLDKLYVTTTGQNRKLKVMLKGDFFDNWLSQDLTQYQLQGAPDSYYIWQGKLYVLPPTSGPITLLAHYHQRISIMKNPQDQPLTPFHLDEAIILSSLIRCHIRASEPQLAATIEAELAEWFDSMRDDEQYLMAEEPERTSPDDTWM